ncbi:MULTISPECIES: carbon storage regulator [unclassified Thioalkalivibrio]|uniref:carbon storage regulator n=1 Tax=unclassified Thioalkalivibrio TaxID=2621013 RepID=UPI000462AEAF|nr:MULTISPECIES: carbon storage regulator [unclassified Thioalkalivibrio]
MLVLTRKVGERLMVGEDIAVEVLDVNGSQARIGVTAPEDMRIDREEVRRQRDQEQKQETD